MALSIFVYAFHYSRSIPQQVVYSRVESVLWQEDGRVHLWRRLIIILLKRGSQLTITLEGASGSLASLREAIECDTLFPPT